MTFTPSMTTNVPVVVGNKKMTYGTYTNTSTTTGGNIDTGLKVCEQLILQRTGSAGQQTAPAVNETLPIDGSAVTIVTQATDAGNWIAFGY